MLPSPGLAWSERGTSSIINTQLGGRRGEQCQAAGTVKEQSAALAGTTEAALPKPANLVNFLSSTTCVSGLANTDSEYVRQGSGETLDTPTPVLVLCPTGYKLTFIQSFDNKTHQSTLLSHSNSSVTIQKMKHLDDLSIMFQWDLFTYPPVVDRRNMQLLISESTDFALFKSFPMQMNINKTTEM